MNYDFEWDPVKDRLNTEDRWVTIGLSASGGVLVVHHTYRESSGSSACIRIISSRKAVRREINQYMEK